MQTTTTLIMRWLASITVKLARYRSDFFSFLSFQLSPVIFFSSLLFLSLSLFWNKLYHEWKFDGYRCWIPFVRLFSILFFFGFFFFFLKYSQIIQNETERNQFQFFLLVQRINQHLFLHVRTLFTLHTFLKTGKVLSTLQTPILATRLPVFSLSE